ncbi:hypothetical protein FQZ97_1090270 [compost metagenome]
MGGVVGYDADAQAIESLDVRRSRALGLGQDDDGEVEIGPGEVQVLLAFGGGHDAGQDIQLTFAGSLEHFAPIAGFHRGELQLQLAADQLDVVGSQALVVALGILEFEGGPGSVDAELQFAVSVEPGLFFRGEREGAGREGPECQPKHQ